LLADRGYDSNEIVEQVEKQGTSVYDKELYRLRHLVENAFMHLKWWRGIATRYAKNTASFLAVVQIRCIVLWAGIS
jgi:transposase